MQFGPEARYLRYLQIRPAPRSVTSEIRSFCLTSLQSCQKTESPFTVQHPICLCNKPYTLLRAAGGAPSRIFQHLCNQTNQTSKIKRGNTHQPLRHLLSSHFTYSKPQPRRNADHCSATAFNRQKANGPASITLGSSLPSGAGIPERP